VILIFKEVNYFIFFIPLVEFVKIVIVMCRKWKEIVDEWVKLNPQGGKNTLMGNLNYF
jgi:hypothetical protein